MLKGISVQAQTSHPVRTSVDQRGEQTINKDAKTSGVYVPKVDLFLLIYRRNICIKFRVDKHLVFFIFCYFKVGSRVLLQTAKAS